MPEHHGDKKAEEFEKQLLDSYFSEGLTLNYLEFL